MSYSKCLSTGYTYTQFVQTWFNAGVARGRGAVKWKRQPPLTDWETKAYPFGYDPKSGILGNSEQASIVGFGSMHGAGVNFCCGDASVHLLPRSTDWETLYALVRDFRW